LLTGLKLAVALHVNVAVVDPASSGGLFGVEYPPTLLHVPFADPGGLVQACAAVRADHAYMLRG
jgi:hypothetical protein